MNKSSVSQNLILKVFSCTDENLDQFIRAGNTQLFVENANNFFFAMDCMEILNSAASSERGSVIRALRRLGLQDLVIKCFSKFQGKTYKEKHTLSVEEISEYAATISFLGRGSEAFLLLKEIQPVNRLKYPLCFLYFAFSLISQWKYKEAIPYLNDFLNNTDSQTYIHSIGQMNLASCFLFLDEFEKAEDILLNCLEKSESTVLRGNLFEIMIELQYSKKNFDKAREFYRQAEVLFSDSKRVEAFYLQKWKHLLSIEKLKTPESEALSKINSFCIHAESILQYESIRDISYYFNFLYPSCERSLKLYLGTPNVDYRLRLKNNFNDQLKEVPESVTLHPCSELLYRSSIEFNSQKNIPHFSCSVRITKAEQLLAFLVGDFFKPWSFQRIYEVLYPGDFFNAEVGNRKIYQIIHQTRELIVQNQLPLTIEVKSQTINLAVLLPIGIEGIREVDLFQTQKFNLLSSRSQNLFLDLKKYFCYENKTFTVEELSIFLQSPKRTIQSHMVELIKLNLISQIKTGRSYSYKMNG